MKWKSRFGVVIGNMLEFYDIAVFAAISGYLTIAFSQQGIAQSHHIVWGIFALRFLSRPLGGYLIGRYADKSGRKSALILTSTLTEIATLLMGFLPINYLGNYAPLVFLLLQLVQSLSFGGEYPTLITYLLSDPEGRSRSKISSLIVGSSLVGVIFSFLIVFALEKTLDEQSMQTIGWRIPLILGVLNIVVSFWFRVRLPELPTPFENQNVSPVKILKIFLMTVPCAVIFYSHNMTSGILRDVLQLGPLKNFYSLFSSGLLLITILIVGFLTDKYSNTRRVFRTGIFSLIIFEIPLYILLGSQNLIYVILAQSILTSIAAMILSNLAAILAEETLGQTAQLGLGYNIALSIFGGLTPLIMGVLLPFGMFFAGVYVAASGFLFVFVHKFLEKKV